MTQSAEPHPSAQQPSTRSLIFSILAMRIVMDTGNKIFFPYLPIISEGLGTTTVELAKLLSWRNLTALVAPALGVTADRRGYRPVIAACLTFSGIGFLTIYFSQGTIGFLIGI